MRQLLILAIALYFIPMVTANAQDEEDILKLIQFQNQLDEQKALKSMSVNAQIYQFGNSNQGVINDVSGKNSGNMTTAIQNGDQNTFVLDLYGSGLTSDIEQKGNNNTINLDVEGVNLQTTINQNGSWNDISGKLVDKNKNTNTVNIIQNNNKNELTVEEDRFNTIPGISIQMDGNMKLIWQNGY